MKREEIEKFINTAREDIIMRSDLIAAVLSVMINTSTIDMSSWHLSKMVEARDIIQDVHDTMVQCPEGPCDTPREAAHRLELLSRCESSLQDAIAAIELMFPDHKIAASARKSKLVHAEPPQFQTPTFITTEVGLN